MAKINRYKLEYGYGSLKQEMTRTLEPVSDSDYIKVSELKEWVKENWFYLFKNEYSPSQRIISVNTLLAAVDTEGKKNPTLQEFIATRKTAIIEEQKKLDSNDPLQVSIACSLEGELSAMNAILKVIGTKEGL